ncbi:hypothetical protein FXO38_04136 [Capsicum annuum]|nr:hypothetical protein FXO38_04136 [Capsicum annuum]
MAGATSIRIVRQGQPNVEALYDQPQTVIDSGISSRGVAGRVVDDGGSYPGAAADTTSHDYEHVGAQPKINTFENTPCTDPSHPYTGPSHPSSPLCSHCKYNMFKDREDKLFEKQVAIAHAVKE